MTHVETERPAFSIRDYRQDDESQVLALLRESLGTGRAFERSTAFWRWKHVDNAFGPSLMLLAANGDLYGLRAFMRWRFQRGGAALTAVRAVDTATNTKYRRLGVFSKLTAAAVDRARSDGVDLIFNTPNRYSLPGYLKLGWTLAGRPRLLVKVRRPVRIAATLAGRGAEGQAAAPPVPAAALIEHEAALTGLLAEDAAHHGGHVQTERSPAFIAWRYARSPELAYGALWLGPRPERAAIVYRPNRRRGLREVMVTELLLGREGGSQAPALVRELVRATDPDYVVAAGRPGSVHWQALRRAGFLPVPRVGPHLTVRPLSPRAEAEGLARLDRWALSLGDLEVF